MEKNTYGLLIIISLIMSLGIASFALCIASEFKKAKRKEIKLDGRLCYLPGSDAFGLGISALVCLCVAHMVGNLIICKGFCSRGKKRSCNEKRSAISIIFFSISWISFAFAVVLISASTSMNTRQPYGKGWLDGDCYIVKDGVFSGGGILASVSVGSTIASGIIRKSASQVEHQRG